MFALLLLTLLAGLEQGFAAEGGSGAERTGDATPSLEELLDAKVTVASGRESPLRETSGIVTIITAEEIRGSGARDLIDVLQKVPGLAFGADTLGMVSLFVRGAWVEEGKVLVLWDGQEVNELFYSNVVFGNHYPLEQISRIEVLRGPGSALHGGAAGLAVINIVSKDAAELGGARIWAQYGQMRGKFAERDVNLAYGRTTDTGSLTAQLFFGGGTRSARDYVDQAGSRLSFAGSSELNPFFANVGARLSALGGDLQLRLIADLFRATNQTGYGSNHSAPMDLSFDSYLAGAQWSFPVSARLRLIPEFNYKRQEPWRVVGPVALEFPGVFFDKVAERWKGRLNGLLDLSPVQLLGGVEYYVDDATSRSAINPASNTGALNVRYTNIGAFAQGDLDLELARVTAGARFEHHDVFGSSFVPRLALTRHFETRAHLKLLASAAFRPPSIENLKLNAAILPERTRVLELEGGYQLLDSLYLTADLFDVRISQPIVYSTDPVIAPLGEIYTNFPRAGTQGAELQLQLRGDLGNAKLAYSHYRAVGENPAYYLSPLGGNSLLGVAAHKLGADATLRLGRDWRLSPSIQYIGNRFGYDFDPDSGALAARKFPPAWLVDLHVSKRELLTQGLEAGFGVFNLLDTDFRYIQAFAGGHPPVPGRSRDFVLKLSYHLPL